MAKNSRKKIVIALVLIGAVGLGYLLFKKKEHELFKATTQGMDLGRGYGATVKQRECMSGLKPRHAECTDTACELSAHGFISECLGTAENDNFCQSVPSVKDSAAARAWADKTCGELQMANTKCESYIHKVLSVCYEQNTGKKRGAGELIQDGFNKGYEEAR